MALRSEVTRWAAKSAVGFGTGLVLLVFWVEILGVRPELAIVLNHLVISVGTYALTDRWVFAGYDSPQGLFNHVRQYISFQVVMLLSNGSKYIIFVALLWVDVHYLVAWTVAAALLFIVSFGGNRWLWKNQIAGRNITPTGDN